MAPAAQLLSNLLAAAPPAPAPLDRHHLVRLQTAATLDGRVEAAERDVFVKLADGPRLDDAQKAGLKRWLRKPGNPEVAVMRKRDPAFDARVGAIATHAQPGDLIFWRATQEGRSTKFRGPWVHVSAVLPGGKLLDSMMLEGASIATPGAVLAKAVRRMNTGEIVIARPKTPLTPAQLKRLAAAAREMQGRDYAVLSPLKDPQAPVSCSRSVHDAFAAAGIELAPEGQRMMRGVVAPADLINGVRAVGTIGLDGAFREGAADGFRPFKPSAPVRWAMRAGDFLLAHVPGLWTVLDRYQANLARALRHG